MCQSPIIRLILTFAAFALATLLFAFVAVRISRDAGNDAARASSAATIADLCHLQQSAQEIAHAVDRLEHGAPEWLDAQAKVRDARHEIMAVWRKHMDWGGDLSHRDLRQALTAFEDALPAVLDAIARENATALRDQSRLRLTPARAPLARAIAAEIAVVLDQASQRKTQRQLALQQALHKLYLLGALVTVLPLLVLAWFWYGTAVGLMAVRDALGARSSLFSKDLFAQLEKTSQSLQAQLTASVQESEALRGRLRDWESERTQLLNRLEYSNQLVQLQQRVCSEGLWEWDIQADQLRFSTRWLAMMGCSEAEAPSSIAAWLDLIHPEDRPQVEAAKLGFVSGNLTAFEFDLRMRHGDGSWKRMKVRTFCSHVGVSPLLLGSQIDRSVELALVSEVEQARGEQDVLRVELVQSRERMLQSAQLAALGRLSSGISEEISTPMGIVLTAASSLDDESRQIRAMLADGQIRRSDLDRYLSLACDASLLVLKHATHAAELARSFRHVATDQVTEEKRQFFIESYFTEILLTLAPQFKQTPHCFLFDCPENVEIDSYPGVFTQIFTNLVGNALQHAFSADRPGVLAIRVRRSNDDELELVFSDNGCGIPAEQQDKVFEPFHAIRKGRGHGGLGLAMTRKLVEDRLSGRIWIEDTPGGGVTVLIRIPLDSYRSKI